MCIIDIRILILVNMTHPHPLLAAGVRPLHRNPQSLLLTTRNSCEAKPYCLLKTPPKKKFPTYDFVKSRQHISCNKDKFQFLFTQFTLFPNMATSNILSLEPQAQYIFTTTLCTYKYSIIKIQSISLQNIINYSTDTKSRES